MNVIPSIKKLEAAVAASHAVPRRTVPRPAMPDSAIPRSAEPHPYIKKLERVLDRMGGLYLVSDILERVNDGRMQCWSENNSVVVTQIGIAPRARVLEVLIAVGKIEDVLKIHERLLDFADRLNIGVIQSLGRQGWMPHALERGWRVKARSFVYQKDL